MSILGILLLFQLLIIPMTLYKDLCLILISKYMFMVEIRVYCGLPQERKLSNFGHPVSEDPGSDHRLLTLSFQW